MILPHCFVIVPRYQSLVTRRDEPEASGRLIYAVPPLRIKLKQNDVPRRMPGGEEKIDAVAR
jgi:hypothetical protein